MQETPTVFLDTNVIRLSQNERQCLFYENHTIELLGKPKEIVVARTGGRDSKKAISPVLKEGFQCLETIARFEKKGLIKLYKTVEVDVELLYITLCSERVPKAFGEQISDI